MIPLGAFTVLTLIFSPVSDEADQFLDRIERDSCQYFLKEFNPDNGLIRDSNTSGSPASIAAVGFGLAALAVAESRDWIGREEAYQRVERTLRFFWDAVPHEHGFFYHFLGMHSGERVWSSEASSIDTAIFIAGALLAGGHFPGTEAERLAQRLYERIDWWWMMNGSSLVCMGWTPERGFLEYYWDSYNEGLLLYALAIGSPTHPIPSSSWTAWARPGGTYAGHQFIHSFSGSLFTYQLPHAWIDFRQVDDTVDWWANSERAIRANRRFCLDHAGQFAGYHTFQWGLSACLGPRGYQAYGAPPGEGQHDGTVAPYAIAAALPFVPEDAISSLSFLFNEYQALLYGPYGFRDAFNLDERWFAKEYLGIDQGLTVLMIENFRTGFVWQRFMELAPIQRWLDLCGLRREDNT